MLRYVRRKEVGYVHNVHTDICSDCKGCYAKVWGAQYRMSGRRGRMGWTVCCRMSLRGSKRMTIYATD